MAQHFTTHKEETLAVCLRWLDYDDYNLTWKSPFWESEFGPNKKTRKATEEARPGYHVVKLRGEQFPAQRIAWALRKGEYPRDGRMVQTYPEYWNKGDTPMNWGHFHHQKAGETPSQKGRKFVNWNAVYLDSLTTAISLAKQIEHNHLAALARHRAKVDQLVARRAYLQMQKEMGKALPLGQRADNPENPRFPAIRGKALDFEEATGRKISEFLDEGTPTLTPEVWQDQPGEEEAEPWGGDD